MSSPASAGFPFPSWGYGHDPPFPRGPKLMTGPVLPSEVHALLRSTLPLGAGGPSTSCLPSDTPSETCVEAPPPALAAGLDRPPRAAVWAPPRPPPQSSAPTRCLGLIQQPLGCWLPRLSLLGAFFLSENRAQLFREAFPGFFGHSACSLRNPVAWRPLRPFGLRTPHPVEITE